MSQTSPARTRGSQKNKHQSNPANGGGNENTARRKRMNGAGGQAGRKTGGVLPMSANEDLGAENPDREDHIRGNANDSLLGL